MIKRSIIGLIALTLLGGPAIPLAKNDEAPALPPPLVRACQDQFPEFKEDGSLDEFTEGVVDSTAKFEQIFTTVQDYYHGYMSCIFDDAVKSINIPEWLTPDVACLDPAKLKEVTNNTGTAALLPHVLKAYNDYSRYLGSLQAGYHLNLLLSSVENAEIVARNTELKTVNETQNALTAISTTFAQLSELRQAFVLHVQFQCMLRNLEEYRTLLGKLRSIVLLLPARIIDASQTR